MYQACLEANKIGMRLEVPPQALYVKEFFAVLYYRPGPGGKAVDFAKNGKTPLYFTSGIRLADGFTLPDELIADSELRLPLKRTNEEYFEIAANVAGFTAGASLPEVQTKKLTWSTKSSSSKAVSSAKPDNVPKKEQICLDNPGDVVFFPETAIAVIELVSPNDPKRNNAEIVYADENRVCMEVRAAAYDDFTGGYTRAHISVLAAATAPIK